MRALIVESNTVNRGILHSQLNSWGMTNRVAATPDQAIETLRKAATRGAPFDIAIIDLGIPGMDALELARAIRARSEIAKVRLVLLTRRQADIRNAGEAGINACLSKPVRQSVLYNCLVNVMAGRPQEEIAMPAVSEPVNTAPLGTRGNILLVEDNLINQQVALGILQILGYSVTVVSNGREALDACTQGAFDLILMDCHMPEMDGFEATKAIRARERASNYRRVPIIALTANAMAHDREECLSAGMDDHLSKPFNTQTMQAMLGRWMSSGESAERLAEGVEKSGSNDAGVLDRQVLDELARVTTNGRPELLANVIDLYLVESPKLLRKLSQAASAGDAPEIVRMAHSLKSSSANVGAMALSRYCARAEMSARRADIEEARLVSSEIEAEHGRVQAALAAEAELLAPARV
jgi:CheY-like chemotaxis protein/HPt (histidine-containing phosphotransfer) domain-containing protein